MEKATIKQLAELSFSGDEINGSAKDFVLKKLSRGDVKRYLFYLREVLRKRQVRVRMPGAPDRDTQRRIADLFPGKKVTFEKDPSYGGGLQVEYGDNVLNITVKNMIDKTIQQLKENL